MVRHMPSFESRQLLASLASILMSHFVTQSDFIEGLQFYFIVRSLSLVHNSFFMSKRGRFSDKVGRFSDKVECSEFNRT